MGHLCPIKTLDFACDDCSNAFARRSPGEIEQVLFPAWKGSVSIENNDHNPVALERKRPAFDVLRRKCTRRARGARQAQGECGKNAEARQAQTIKRRARGGKAGAGDCRASAGRTWGEENARGRKGGRGKNAGGRQGEGRKNAGGRGQSKGKGRAGGTRKNVGEGRENAKRTQSAPRPAP